jgi:GGDEF domain-containing protein
MKNLNKENVLSPYPTERRVALEKRLRVSEMSAEEMRRELLTSQVTGLRNRRAFDEARPAPAVGMCDMDGLKALNKYGYEVGNAVLLANAGALRQVGLKAYHDKGDEFLCRGGNIEELVSKLEEARAILRDHRVIVKRPDGSRLKLRGVDFSYGVGRDIDEAESALRRHKAERERTGCIARGELRSITVTFAKSKGLICTAADLARGRAIGCIPIHNSASGFTRITSVILSQPKSVKSSSARCNSP